MKKAFRSEERWKKRLFAPVKPDHLAAALRVLADMDAEDRNDIGGRALALIKHFHQPGNKPEDLRVADLTSAIQFRLEALDSLRDRPEMVGWTLPSGADGCDLINGALLEVAADEPIVQIDEYHVTFSPDSFFKRVLAVSDLSGEA
ncbi:MAG: hypothetical protein ACK4X1_11590 [Terricaulis sp.]